MTVGSKWRHLNEDLSFFKGYDSRSVMAELEGGYSSEKILATEPAWQTLLAPILKSTPQPSPGPAGN